MLKMPYNLHQLFILLVLVACSLATNPIDLMFGNDPVLNSTELEEEAVSSCSSGIIDLTNITIKEILGQWHLPYMSSNWMSHLDEPMKKQVKLRKHSAIMGTFCIKVNIKELPSGGTSNNPDATLLVQSKCPRCRTHEYNLACARSRVLNAQWVCNNFKDASDNEDSNIFIADGDNKTWALIIRCFPNKGVRWAIFSKVKFLDPMIVKSALDKVQRITGYKLFNIVEVPYEKCMTNPK